MTEVKGVRLSFEQWPGTLGPVSATPDRRPGSIRRTTSIHSTWPDGFEGPLVLRGIGRDLVTTTAACTTVDSVELTLATEPGRRLVADVTPTALQPLVGANLSGGFRRAAAGVVEEPGSVLGLLLDDAPAAALVSGSSSVRARIEATGAMPVYDMPLPVVCIGRRPGGAMTIGRRSGRPLLGQGPAAGRLERDDDPLAWAEEPPLALLSMRRRRRIDVWIEDQLVVVDTHFRDSRVEPDGVETSVHEYEVIVTAGTDDGAVRSVEVHPRVLPGPDCPGAVAGVQRVVGTALGDLRAFVRAELQDEHDSCTHLNDQLRSVADAPRLVELLRAAT